MRARLDYIIITPVRNESPYIEKTIKSVIDQTILPHKWIIVNDGSTDGTKEILDKYSTEISWIEVVHRMDRGHRASGSGVIEAFYDGYSKIGDSPWDFIVKLDGDLYFDADYFQKCLDKFVNNPNLGIGGGTVLSLRGNQLRTDSKGDPLFHVRGATKIYRRDCFEKISPLLQSPGWDTIDEIKANFYGWSTRSFDGINLIQCKATGEADGQWKNWFKNGVANYIAGYHPLFMIAKCCKRLFTKPLFIASVALLAGFCSGYIKGTKRVQDDVLVNYLRRQQIRRLMLRRSIYG